MKHAVIRYTKYRFRANGLPFCYTNISGTDYAIQEYLLEENAKIVEICETSSSAGKKAKKLNEYDEVVL